MNRIILSVIVVILVIASGIGMYVFTQKQDIPQIPNTPVSFPSATSSTNVTVNPDQKVIAVGTANGNQIVVQDFKNNGVTYKDTQNEGRYYIAGSLGYCLTDGTCPSGAESSSYIIVFDQQSQTFILSLTEEPIGEARKKAEQFLAKELGLQSAQLCQLKTHVSTTADVNDSYAGVELGISGCEGSVRLPL